MNKRVADALRGEGHIDDADHAAAVDFARRKNIRIEEALLRLGLIEEARLLKCVATLHKTQFVSTERMSKAKIDRAALKAISKKLASHFNIYPLVLDRKSDKLIIATADPDDTAAIKELKLAAGVQRVLPMVARPEAVVAAIARGYDGDRSHFNRVLQPPSGFSGAPADDDPFETAERRRRERRTGAAASGGRDAGSRPGARRRLRRTGRPVTGDYSQMRDRAEAARRTRQPTGSRDPERGYDDNPYESHRDPYSGRPETPRRGQLTGPPDPAAPWYDQSEPSYPSSDYRPPRRRTSPSMPAYRDDPGYPPPRHASPPHGHQHDTHTPVPHTPAPHSPIPHSPIPHSPIPHNPGSHAPTHPSPPRGRGQTPVPHSPARHPPEALYEGARGTPAPTPQHGYSAPIPGYPSTHLRRFGELPTAHDGSPISSRPRRRLSMIPPMRAMAVAPGTAGFGTLSERQPTSDPPDPTAILNSPTYLESLRVLIGLLENERAHLRAHSNAVARLALSLCERVSLPNEHSQAIVLASYLHDLGKMGSIHLTALNVALFDDHRDLATKLVAIPQQLMESVGLSEATVKALGSMYEQMGGGGLPEGLAGKEIPMGARILAVTDSFADLTRNSHNAHGTLLTSEDALALMREYGGTVFDANLLDVLEEATGGERILTDLLANRHRVLLVDPDPEETMVLQLRLVEQGFDVHVARTVEEARTAFENHEFALVVSEIDLDEPDDGFRLLEENAQKAAQINWVFLSGRDSRETAERAFKLHADDFLTKPISTEIVVAKLGQLVERQAERVAPRGVSGSLSEMGLADIVQILWHGRKTCALVVSQGDTQGAIHFQEGQIVNALWDDAVAETAFYRMLTIGGDGEFRVDPEFVPEGEPAIQISPEGLLLEGMRLLDENQIP